MGESGERKTPVPDGWGSSESSVRPSSRESRSRKRITLSFAGPALELPSDDAALGEPTEPPSAELELPEDYVSERAPDLEQGGAGTAHGAVEALDGRDAWQLSRSSPTSPPPPMRPRSEHPPAVAEESTESLRLVSTRSRPTAHQPDLAAEMDDRFALGDFTGALRAAELILGQAPGDAEAALVAARSRERLVQFHLARLGGPTSVLGLKVAGAEVRWLGLDHRAGFLLSLVDGTTTVDEIVDLSGMPRHEALRLLAELRDGGAIGEVS
jgi:hypothetical protein